MFKVNNKDTKTMTGIILVSLLSLFRVSVVNFEQVNAGWIAFTLPKNTKHWHQPYSVSKKSQKKRRKTSHPNRNFKSRCCHLNFTYRACFEKNIQLNAP